MKARRILGLVSAIGLILTASACAPTLKTASGSSEAVQAEQQKQREMAFSVEVQRNDRLMNVALPLLVSATEICGDDTGGHYGLVLHGKDTYQDEFRGIAVRYFKLDDRVAVRYVHSKFPAAEAGLKAGDRILAINGENVENKSAKAVWEMIQNPNKRKPFNPMFGVIPQLLQTIQTSRELPPLNLTIERNSQSQQMVVQALPVCKYQMVLANADAVNAFADGKNVVITTGMIRFVESDTELALVVGHEIAHNALGHIKKKTVNAIPGMILDVAIGVLTGVRTNFFANMASQAFSQGFESEADYAGLYIAGRAGLDLTGAANFWRRMAAEHPASISTNFLATHPSTPERFIAIEQTVKEIDEKRRIGAPLLPEKKETEKKEEEAEKKDEPPVGDR